MKRVLRILKKRWYLVLAAVFIVGFFIYRSTAKPKETSTSHTVRRQTLKEELSFSGSIDADEKATLRFQSSGKLAWVGVKEGDRVDKFQLIASLDQASLKKSLQKELNDYMKSRIDFDQEKDDTRPVVIGAQSSDKQLELRRIADKTQSDLDNAVIDVELQDLAVRLANLATPIQGIVTKVLSPFAGVNITPTQAEFEGVNPETIYFSASADQTDVVSLNEGMVGEVVLDSFPESKIQAEIINVSFTPDEDETGTVYKVKMTIDDPVQLQYRLGMTGDV
ncbi:MAG: efflux RND transporter periplasmic adaptor subunit, partial [Patescibacteria group bacterium]